MELEPCPASTVHRRPGCSKAQPSHSTAPPLASLSHTHLLGHPKHQGAVSLLLLEGELDPFRGFRPRRCSWRPGARQRHPLPFPAVQFFFSEWVRPNPFHYSFQKPHGVCRRCAPSLPIPVPLWCLPSSTSTPWILPMSRLLYELSYPCNVRTSIPMPTVFNPTIYYCYHYYLYFIIIATILLLSPIKLLLLINHWGQVCFQVQLNWQLIC
jgi:hypothetical protein